MPQMTNKAPEPMVCDGCGMERYDIVEDAATGARLCPGCAERYVMDPIVTILGRTLHISEMRAQAKDDKGLAAALDGDTVQSQIKAKR